MTTRMNATAAAIRDTLSSPNVVDSNLEDANVVDVIHQLANATNRIANAILPAGVAPGRDATGGGVDSLTEAVMGLTQAGEHIAGALFDIAEAIRESKP